MRIVPLAADSMGARSMCTFVETEDCNILIDPSVRVGPHRYGLPPHPSEKKRRAELWRAIREKANRAKVFMVSHYHFDHHNPDAPSLFRGKTALLKDYENKTNKNQGNRGRRFANKIGRYAKEVVIADGEEFRFGDTEVVFSEPVVHGVNERMGYVLEVCIREGDSAFVHTSDIVGGSRKNQVDFIIGHNPQTVVMDGALSYMMGIYGKDNMERSQRNIVRLIEKTDLRTLVLDHHLLREKKWMERIPLVLKSAKERRVKLLTCAGYLGRSDELLEARRKDLFGKSARRRRRK
jgi:predicted metallo-beta-lactamase superfamily hydrolase